MIIDERGEQVATYASDPALRKAMAQSMVKSKAVVEIRNILEEKGESENADDQGTEIENQ